MESTTPLPPKAMNEAARRSSVGIVERITPLIIFLFSFAYLCAFLRYSSLEPDEGILLQGGQRILDGQLPYRDFFSFYTPGSFYLIAGLFKAFGDSFAVARLSLAITGATCSTLTYLLARRVCSRGIALFVAALTTGSGVAYRFLVLHNWFSTLLACLALYSALRLLESRKPLWGFATGSFCSLTTMFEQSKGGGLCLGLALGFAILRWIGKEPLFRRFALANLAVGFAWPLVLVFAYFRAQHSWGIMVEDWFWPLHHYTSANHVFYGYQNWSDDARYAIFHEGPIWVRAIKTLAVSPGFLVPALPLLALGLLAYWLSPGHRESVPSDKWTYYAIICSVVTGLLISVLVVRADIIHFMYLSPVWYVPLAWVLDGRDFRSSTLHALRPYFVMLVGAAFGLMSLVLLTTANGAHYRVATRRGFIVSSAPDQVIQYVQNQTVPGEKILVYPYLPLYYYLTATRSSARLDYFQPGMNTPEQAQQIISSLRLQQMNRILFEPAFAEKMGVSWPGTQLGSLASDPVADYLARNYRVCKVLTSAAGSSFEFMVQKAGRCP